MVNTIDGGKTWTLRKDIIFSEDLGDIFFVNALHVRRRDGENVFDVFFDKARIAGQIIVLSKLRTFA